MKPNIGQMLKHVLFLLDSVDSDTAAFLAFSSAFIETFVLSTSASLLFLFLPLQLDIFLSLPFIDNPLGRRQVSAL